MTLRQAPQLLKIKKTLKQTNKKQKEQNNGNNNNKNSSIQLKIHMPFKSFIDDQTVLRYQNYYHLHLSRGR